MSDDPRVRRVVVPGASTGRVVVVTGASRGIGAALAIRLAGRGDSVVCIARTVSTSSRTPGTLDDTIDAIRAAGGTAHAIVADLSDEQQTIESMLEAALVFGRVDVLVNNAAAAIFGDGSTMSQKAYEVTMAVNVRAAMLMSEIAIEKMSEVGGDVVNVSSIAACVDAPGYEVYGMSKAALEHLTITTARRVVARSVRVNCLRVDCFIGSEGALQATGGQWLEGMLVSDVAAAGIEWILDQRGTYTGRVVELSSLPVADPDALQRSRRLAIGANPPISID